MKIKALLLLPLTYNDGSSVEHSVVLDVLDKLYALCNGWTIEGEVEGAYRMESGEKKVEKLLKVAVVLDQSDFPELKKLVTGLADSLDQESMYLEQTNSVVEFVARARQRARRKRKTVRKGRR